MFGKEGDEKEKEASGEAEAKKQKNEYKITGQLIPIEGGKEGMKQEYSMFELQGTLERHGVPFDGQELGQLELKARFFRRVPKELVSRLVDRVVRREIRRS